MSVPPPNDNMMMIIMIYTYVRSGCLLSTKWPRRSWDVSIISAVLTVGQQQVVRRSVNNARGRRLFAVVVRNVQILMCVRQTEIRLARYVDQGLVL